MKNTYVDFLDISRAAHDLRQGRRRKSSSARGRGEVGHCHVVGQSEEWGVGGWPGPAGFGSVSPCRSARRCTLNQTCDQTRGNSGKLRSRCAESRVEIQEELTRVNAEVGRRTETYRTVVSAIAEFNNRTCNIEPWCQDGFEAGLKEIICRFTQNINVTLGVTTNKYTIESYFLPEAIEGECGPRKTCIGPTGLCMEFFYSPQVGRAAPGKLTNNSPVNLGCAKQVPCEQHVASDRQLFYDGNTLKPNVYFRRFATLVFPTVCSPTFLGVLVLTADQDEPFAEDVLDTMQFMGSLIANYVDAYNRCVYEYRENKGKPAVSAAWSRSSRNA